MLAEVAEDLATMGFTVSYVHMTTAYLLYFLYVATTLFVLYSTAK